MLVVAERFSIGNQADANRPIGDLRRHIDAARRDAVLRQGVPTWGRRTIEKATAGEACPVDADTAARLFVLAVMTVAGRPRPSDPTPADLAALVDIHLDGIAAR